MVQKNHISINYQYIILFIILLLTLENILQLVRNLVYFHRKFQPKIK